MHRLMAAAFTGGILQGRHRCLPLSPTVRSSLASSAADAAVPYSGSGGREEKGVGTVIVEGSVTVPTTHVITAVHSVGRERMSRQTSNQLGASRLGREAGALLNRRVTRGV